MRTSRTVMSLSAAALLVAAATGCAGDDKPSAKTKAEAGAAAPTPTESTSTRPDGRVLAETSIAILRRTDDYTMTGVSDEDGEHSTFDICLRTGGELKGTMSVDGGKLDLIVVAGQQYIRADATILAQQAKNDGATNALATSLAGLYAGKYTKVPVGAGRDLPDFTDVFEGDTSGITVGEAVTIDGRQLTPLVKAYTDATDTLYIARGGEPRPVLFTSEAGGRVTTTIKFAAGTTKCEPTAPPADQVTERRATTG